MEKSRMKRMSAQRTIGLMSALSFAMYSCVIPRAHAFDSSKWGHDAATSESFSQGFQRPRGLGLGVAAVLARASEPRRLSKPAVVLAHPLDPAPGRLHGPRQEMQRPTL